MKKIFITGWLFLAVNLIYGQDENRIIFGSLECSPAGDKIIFSAISVKSDWSNFKPENWVVLQYNLADKSLIEISTGGLYASYSPDGNSIIFEKRTGESQNIFVRDLDSGNEFQLTDNEHRNFGGSWSPDGQQIVYNSNQTGTIEIFICNKDGTNHRQLTFSGVHKSYNPKWSPFGNDIVYYFEKGDGKDQIYVMNSNGEKVRNITNNDSHSYYPSWRDEKSVVFAADPDEIHTISLDGSKNQPILGIKSFYAVFSRDGSKLFFINTADKDRLTINIMEIKSSKTSILLAGGDLEELVKN
jgi:Tol biopolymer transport system component